MAIREQIVSFLHSVNVFLLGALGCGLLFAVDSVIPGLCTLGKGAARNYGAFALVYAMLISSLGPTHHGGYCLTMTLHFALMAVNFIQAKELATPDGSLDTKLAAQAGFNLVMFASMLLLLINGGIGAHSHSGKASSKSE